MSNKDRIQYLLTKYFDKTASAPEEEELFGLLNASAHDEEIKKAMDSFWGKESQVHDIDKESAQKLLQSVLRGDRRTLSTKPKVIQGRFAWLKVAAVALLVISAGFWLLRGRLANRTEFATTPRSTPTWKTVHTEKGGQQLVLLPDSSRVWLNASSEIKYPTTFADTARIVYIKGEAYFEVATRFKKQEKLPFIVKFANDAQVEVLGTHFNIRAYGNPEEATTTLLEGSVKVKRGQSESLLQPGQQARFKTKGGISVVNDEEAVRSLAWKNGLFDFRNESIGHIMSELARWYNIQYEFKDVIPDQHYTGSMRRQVSIEQVLIMLESAGSLQFSINNNKVIIRNKPN